MMKKWTAVLLACMMMCTFVSGAMAADKCSHTSMPGYESVYFEGFEGDCEDLLFVDPHNIPGLDYPEMTGFGKSEDACDGRYFVFLDSIYALPEEYPDLDTWLILPKMKLDANSILTFRAKIADAEYPEDCFRVVMLDDPQRYWEYTELAEYKLNIEHLDDWATFTFDLSKYAGERVHLAFLHQNQENGHEMWIDCVHIWEPAQPGLPQTGDNSNIALWIGLMAISFLGAAALSRKAKKAC